MKLNAKRFFIIIIFLMMTWVNSLYSATVTGSLTSPNTTLFPQATIDAEFDQFRQQIENEINTNWNNQSELAKGFSNATAYSSHSAPFDGYHGYSLFGIVVGMTVSAQAPFNLAGFTGSDVNKVSNDIRDKGDVFAGVGGGASVNVGLNAGMIAKGLYLNAKFWKYSYNLPSSYTGDNMDVSGDIMTAGIGANYQFLKSRSLFGLITWRGISLGTGFIYNKNKLDMELRNISGLALTYDYLGIATMTMEPSLKLGYTANTYVIPLEAHTAVKVLILNVNLGAGADLMFGGTEITIRNTNDVLFQDNANLYSSTGYMTIDASTPKTAPTKFKPKLMGGVGLTVLGALINVNATWYINDGAALGVSAGFVW